MTDEEIISEVYETEKLKQEFLKYKEDLSHKRKILYLQEFKKLLKIVFFPISILFLIFKKIKDFPPEISIVIIPLCGALVAFSLTAISATRTTSLQLCNQTLADNADLCNRAYEKCLLKENDKNNKEVVRDYTICVNAIGTTRCDLIFYKCDKK